MCRSPWENIAYEIILTSLGLVRLIWLICLMRGKWPYSRCFVECCFQNWTNWRSILVQFPYCFFSLRFVSIPGVHLYTSTDTATVWNKSCFFYRNDQIFIYSLNFSDKIKRELVQAVVVLVLLYGCTTFYQAFR